MAQNFLEYQALDRLVREHPDATAIDLLGILTPHFQPIVCGVGLDDINDITEDRDEEGESPLTMEQMVAALDVYAHRFDWTICHSDLREAIDEVRAETSEGGEKYI